MKNLKHYFTLACGIVLLLTLSTGPATAQTITEIQVTNDAFFQQSPAISGNRIVWGDQRNGVLPDIFMFDALTLTETQITTTGGVHSDPAISANRIVWRDFSTGRSEIFMHDLGTASTTQITNDVTNQLTVAIDGTRIVWHEQDEAPPFVQRLVVRDLAGGTLTEIPSMPGSTPAIADHLVVWADNRAGNTDIFLYNLNTNTETRITDHSAAQGSPDISGQPHRLGGPPHRELGHLPVRSADRERAASHLRPGG